MCCCCPSIELILEALDQAKHRFYKDTKQAHDEQTKDLVVAQTQCDKALKDAISTLSNMQKNKKRALKKKKNLNLKNGIETAYRQLTQLQLYSGSDKILRCFEFAMEWRYVMRRKKKKKKKGQLDVAAVCNKGQWLTTS